MKTWRFVFLIAGASASCGGPRKVEMATPTPALQPGWNRVAGDQGTKCALGADYAFFVRPGDPQKLLVYFQGGGACWNGLTCNVERRSIYRPVVGAEPYRGGILNLDRAENPLRGYTAVFVPYCTGDVHLGARVAAYPLPAITSDSARSLRVFHYGAANATSALRWAFTHIEAPQIVVVAGESAGSIPSPFYAVQVARQYPRARVVQLGDASGAYRHAAALFGTWGVGAVMRAQDGFRSIDSTSAWIPELYKLAARAAKRVVLSEVNAVDDTTQAFFVRVAIGEGRPVAQLLAENLATIRAAAPNFHSYTLPGPLHAIIPRPEFYTTAVDGVPLHDWVADLVNGKPVRDIGASLLPQTRR